MAKLASAEEVIALIKSGKYTNAVNAKRGTGRTRISKSEKEKVYAFIASFFPDDGSTPKAAKPAKKKATRVAKKVSKKVAAKAEGAGKKKVHKVGKRPKGHAVEVAQADGDTTEGTLPISPAQVSSVADILKLIDSTVTKSVSIMGALKSVKEFGTNEDVSEGIANIRRALTGASVLLNDSVIAPLTKGNSKADPDVTARLEQVVAAASAPPPTNHIQEPPPPPAPYLPPPEPVS